VLKKYIISPLLLTESETHGFIALAAFNALLDGHVPFPIFYAPVGFVVEALFDFKVLHLSSLLFLRF
jgi:hypothetical protein